MREIVFLLEEPSMKALLDNLLPIILPDNVFFTTIKHEGKTDLEDSIPRKLRAFRIPETKFVVMRDQDSVNCIQLKQRLVRLCEAGNRSDTLVRIVCHELESWFLGDLLAVEKAFGIRGLAAQQNTRKYRNPDALGNPCQVLKSLVPNYQKISGAREISRYMDIEANTSISFQTFITGVKNLAST